MHNTNVNDKFRLAWSWLTEKVKIWAKENIISLIMSTCVYRKEILPVALPSQNIQWVFEIDICHTLQEENDNGLGFVKKKLELINK